MQVTVRQDMAMSEEFKDKDIEVSVQNSTNGSKPNEANVGNSSKLNLLSEEKPFKFLTCNIQIRNGSLLAIPQIHHEFAGLLPPDTEAYSALEKMIIRDGRVTTPIITCIIDGIEFVLDGYMPLDICIKHGINDFIIETLDNIHTTEEGVCWIVFNACSKPQLNKAQRVKLIRHLKPMLDAIAKANQKLGAELKSAFTKSVKAGKPVHVLKELAKMAGTSPDFFSDADFVLEHGTAKEKHELLEKGYGASTIRKKIETSLEPPSPELKVIPYTNSKEGDYLNQIINSECIKTLKDMAYHGIRDVALLVTSINYNVKMNYGPNFSDDLERAEYLENIAQAIYHTQLLGRNGMKICINCTDTNNRNETDNNNFQFDIGKDLCNKVDELNAKYDDCNLRFVGRFIWYKKHSNANPCLGSKAAPVIKNDSEYILIWAKNQRKLENISGLNCKPGSGSIFSDEERDKYIITEKERMAWSYQTWCIPPCNDKKLLDVHPCPYPEDIPYRLIKMLSFPNDIVIDPYAGLCTTCKVAADLKRRYVGIEQHSTYCDFGKKRIQAALEGKHE